jgi:hypothetical protein
MQVLEDYKNYAVNVNDAMTFLRVYDNQDPDSIFMLIEAASEQVEKYVQRDTYTRVRQGYWDNYGAQIWLPYGPHGDVTEVKAVTTDGIETVLQVGTQYRVSRTTWKIIDILERKGEQLFVTYESGYSAGTCPQAIRAAILQEVSFQYKNRQDPNQTAGLSLGILTVESMHLLTPYKRLNF